jgi:hypothetical protein
MTRKDYILIAEVFRRAHAYNEEPLPLLLAVLKGDNPRFNAEHFVAVVLGKKSLTSRPGRKS